MNIQKLGNTTAATIPSVLAEHIANGDIQRGHKLCLVAFGGGLTSGGLLATY
jgi:3-oxoacyl-[acyl-carrier-protein] synthase-3